MCWKTGENKAITMEEPILNNTGGTQSAQNSELMSDYELQSDLITPTRPIYNTLFAHLTPPTHLICSHPFVSPDPTDPSYLTTPTCII